MYRYCMHSTYAVHYHIYIYIYIMPVYPKASMPSFDIMSVKADKCPCCMCPLDHAPVVYVMSGVSLGSWCIKCSITLKCPSDTGKVPTSATDNL